MFWMRFLCKPAAKFLLKYPFVGALVIVLVYLYIAYRCLQSAWEYNYRKTASNQEIGARWQQTMGLSNADLEKLTGSHR